MILRDIVLQRLQGKLWHTTHPDRFNAILAKGAILPEAEISDSERWGTAAGQEHYPYVRFLGGVSLFDFNDFDPSEYEKRCPASSWAYFVPCHLSWDCAVWIEIDRAKVVAPQFISGTELISKWKTEGAYGHNIMPEIEAAYLGSISTAAFKQAFLVRKSDSTILQLTRLQANAARF